MAGCELGNDSLLQRCVPSRGGGERAFACPSYRDSQSRLGRRGLSGQIALAYLNGRIPALFQK